MAGKGDMKGPKLVQQRWILLQHLIGDGYKYLVSCLFHGFIGARKDDQNMPTTWSNHGGG